MQSLLELLMLFIGSVLGVLLGLLLWFISPWYDYNNVITLAFIGGFFASAGISAGYWVNFKLFGVPK